MLIGALDAYRLPARLCRLETENWKNIDVRAWQTVLRCLDGRRVRSLPVRAGVDDDQLWLSVFEEDGRIRIGRPGHDPDVAAREMAEETWIDPSTGLMWLSRPVLGPFTTTNPFEVIEDLHRHNGEGTFCDWRLPCLNELRSLQPPMPMPAPGLVHPALEPCRADPALKLLVYGCQPASEHFAHAIDPHQQLRHARIFGFDPIAGKTFRVCEDDFDWSLWGRWDGREAFYRQGQVHLLAVRGQGKLPSGRERSCFIA